MLKYSNWFVFAHSFDHFSWRMLIIAPISVGTLCIATLFLTLLNQPKIVSNWDEEFSLFYLVRRENFYRFSTFLFSLSFCLHINSSFFPSFSFSLFISICCCRYCSCCCCSCSCSSYYCYPLFNAFACAKYEWNNDCCRCVAIFHHQHSSR